MTTMQILPVILIAIAVAVETIMSSLRDLKVYDKQDSIVNFFIGCFSIVVALMLKGITFEILSRIGRHTPFNIPGNFLSGLFLFLLCDMQYYWFHRLGHVSRFFWASHAIHHSSKQFNYTVGMRLPFTNSGYRFMILLPASFLGFNPGIILLTDALINYYTFFTHTETIGKLGWFEKFLNTPSHHRVHHSSNPQYIDKNFGGALIIWDKLFGTYSEEKEKPLYGLTKSFCSYNPIKIALDEWQEMICDLKSSTSFGDTIKIIFGYPGWKPEMKSKENAIYTRERLEQISFGVKSFSIPVHLSLQSIRVSVFSICILMLSSSFTLNDSYNWELKKNETGIEVYTKDIPGNALKQIRVVTTVRSSLSGIVALLLDTKKYPTWMEGCKEAEIIKTINDHEVYNYQVTDLPWPITDRDVIADFKIDQDAATGVVRFMKTASPQFIPANANFVRIQNLQCLYTLTPVSKDSVLLEMELTVDPGGSIPAWLINANVVAAPFKSTSRMIKRLQQYQSARFSFIKEAR